MSDDVTVEDHVLADAELITAVRRGDTAAFGMLFARHSAAATAVARRYLSESDADDAVAGAFEKVLEVLRAGKGPDVAFRAYLFTVVRRRAIEMLDRGRRAAPTDDDNVFETAVGPLASSEDPALKGFEDRTVARAFAALPERWRSVLWYTDIEGLSPAEVAPALGMTPNAVSALAYRAREGLRQSYLQAHLADAGEDEACRRANAQLGAYVRGGLSRREATRVEEHLEDCARCRAVALELGDLAAGMRATVAPLVVGLLGVAALGGLPLVLAGAGAGAASGGAADGKDGARAAAAAAAVAAGVGTAGGAGVGAGAGAAGAALAAGGAGIGGGAGVWAGSRWLVGAAAAVAGVLVLGGIGLGAGWFDDDDAPPTAGSTSTVAVPSQEPSSPGASGPGTPTALPSSTASSGATAAPTAAPATVRPTAGPTAEPTAGPTVRPTAEPTAGPTVRPTPGPTVRPTAEPTSRPTSAPTTTPTSRPTSSPTAPPPTEPAVDPSATVAVAPSTVLVAGGAGTLDLAVERSALLTAPLSVTVTLPAGATWDGSAAALAATVRSGWTCAVLGPRTATCTLPATVAGGTSGGVTSALTPLAAARAAVPDASSRSVATVTDTLPFGVLLDAAVVDPGLLTVDVASGAAAPTTRKVPLGRALAVAFDAHAASGTLALRSAPTVGSAPETLTVDVRNPGRALTAAFVELTVPDALSVVGDLCLSQTWSGGTTRVRCIVGPLDAGASHSLELEVSAVAAAPLTLTRLPLELVAAVDETSHSVAAGVDVQIDTDRASLRARFQGAYQAVEIGAPTIHCAPTDAVCSLQAEGTANNDAVAGRVVLDGLGGRPLSTSTLDLPQGAQVVGAYLVWGASAADVGSLGLAEQRASGTLVAPDGTSSPVAGTSALASSSLGSSPLGGRDFYQSTVDVTALVADGGAGEWSFVPAVAPATDKALFAGWGLTVVVRVPGAPDADVRVYDALDVVSGTGSIRVGFATDADADVRLGTTVWEGDRGIAGDAVTLEGAPLAPRGGLADAGNAFDSTAAGFEHANSFGVDVRSFLPARAAAGSSTLTFSTNGDAYALAAFTLTITPH